MTGKPEASIKISLIEPDASEVAWTRKLVESCSLSAELADAMSAEEPDFNGADIIMIGLQNLSGPATELLAKLKARFPLTPLIVLAGTDAADWSGAAVRLGAQHVLDKSSLTPEKLSSTLRYYAHYVGRPDKL